MLLAILGQASFAEQKDLHALEEEVEWGKQQVLKLRDSETTPKAITFDEALHLAFEHNSTLSAASSGVSSSEGRVHQMGLVSNPEFEFEIEEFAGSGSLKGVDAAEYTFSLTQEIELGAKRSHRQHRSSLQVLLAQWDYRRVKLDLRSNVGKLFVDALAAQENIVLSQELIQWAEELYRTAEKRVTAGAASSVELLKANMALSRSRVVLDKAKRALENKNKKLAATWNRSQFTFDKVVGELYTLATPLSEEVYMLSLSENPDLKRLSDEAAIQRLEVSIQKAERIPNLTLGGGLKWLEESNDQAFVARMGIDLPLFNRNQGNRLVAVHELARGDEERRASFAELQRNVTEAYQLLTSAYIEATTFVDSLLPMAQEAFKATKAGYLQGKFGYLEVLDAQRTLFDTRLEYIDVCVSYFWESLELERLTTRSPQLFQPSTEEGE